MGGQYRSPLANAADAEHEKAARVAVFHLWRSWLRHRSAPAQLSVFGSRSVLATVQRDSCDSRDGLQDKTDSSLACVSADYRGRLLAVRPCRLSVARAVGPGGVETSSRV